jgi:hypothetical protein
MIVPLEKKVEVKDPDIYLFEIPSDVILGVIFGYRCEDRLKEYVFNLKLNKYDMTHLSIYEAIPNLNRYIMDIKNIS